jgi:hypothetical protein
MATPVTKSQGEQENYGRFALSGYNAFGFSDVEQAAFANKAAVAALMDTKIATYNYDKAEEMRRYKEDWIFGSDALGVTDADVSGSNTVAVFRAILTALLVSGIPASYVTQDHKSVVSA